MSVANEILISVDGEAIGDDLVENLLVGGVEFTPTLKLPRQDVHAHIPASQPQEVLSYNQKFGRVILFPLRSIRPSVRRRGSGSHGAFSTACETFCVPMAAANSRTNVSGDRRGH